MKQCKNVSKTILFSTGHGGEFYKISSGNEQCFLFLFYLIMFSKFSTTLLLVQNNFCKAHNNLPSVNCFCFELTQLELEKQDCH